MNRDHGCSAIWVYMRVSSNSDRQSTDLQKDALLGAGVDPRHLFGDKASGSRDDRPGLKEALSFVKSGDTLVVWKLDRLGRSLTHLIEIINTLTDNDVAFRSPISDRRHGYRNPVGRTSLPHLWGTSPIRTSPYLRKGHSRS